MESQAAPSAIDKRGSKPSDRPVRTAKHFNTAGPNISSLHYELDPLVRIDSDLIKDLIEQQRYFVLHAPRQTGKTTCLLAMRDLLNQEARYSALYVNIEGAQAARNDVNAAAQSIVSQLIKQAALTLGIESLSHEQAHFLSSPIAAISSALYALSAASSKPVVLFLDEVDALVGDTLISLLRQIRAGYADRPKHFPQSIVLCGVRDVRDYRMTMADGEVITGGSAFNIKAESLRLGNFSRAEMEALYAQHTLATGQIFSSEAIEIAWYATQGQPWLVNALAEQAVWKTQENRDRAIVIDAVKMRAAREALILRNDSHLDQLVDKLKEPRVRAVIEPMLTGEAHSPDLADRQYLLDLGLIRQDDTGLAPANGIYAEVLPRMLASKAQSTLHVDMIQASWRGSDGALNPRQFLDNFFAFWRLHGEVMMRNVPYHEAAPTLVLMAYLQRVVNGAGRIEREYAAGSGRMDLLVEHGDVRMAIEVKVWRDKQADPKIAGIEQLERYLARHGLAEGFLVIFDQRTHAPEWLERMGVEQTISPGGRSMTVMRG
jgi:type II secretory pathway predicted ATPase ExeA